MRAFREGREADLPAVCQRTSARLWGSSLLQEVQEFCSRNLAIPEDLMEQAWTDRLASVGGYNRASPVLMTQEMMATSDAQNAKAGLPKRANEIGPGDARTPAHAAMVTRW